MKKKLLSVLLVFGVVAMALAIPALAKTKSVEVDDNYFVSKKSHTINITHGTKVNWHWEGSNIHNVTLTKAPHGVKKFHSATKEKGVYAHTFTKVGTYTIICTVHAPGMKMTIHVK
jgi:plastocyanin